MNLNKIYNDLINEKITTKDAVDILTSRDMRQTINALINKDRISPGINYTDQDIQTIFQIINITQFIYNTTGEFTGLTDSEYDKLYEIMVMHGGDDVISAPLPKSTKKIGYHKYPSLRGTLKKVYYLSDDETRTNPSRKYLSEWVASMETKYFDATGKKINLENEYVLVFPKFDGVSAVFELNSDNNIERVLTRGYTELNEAQDITKIFSKMPKRQYKEFRSEYGLKTEIMMNESYLKAYNKKYGTDYKSTRSIVSSIINSDEFDPEKIDLLRVIPLRVGLSNGSQQLASEALEEFPHIKCKLKDVEKIREFALKNAYVNKELRCDGAVIYIIDPEIQKVLGRENDINNYEVAYKFTEESALTKLIDIEFQLGLFGRVSPVAKIKPVKLKGNTIDRVSLGSIGRVRDLNLRYGDTVKILYDIIPYLAFDADCQNIMYTKDTIGDVIKIPKKCPECKEELQYIDSNDILQCTNPDCPCRIKGKILNYLNKMDIDNISYGTIDKLYEYGIVTTIEDLYKLNDVKKELELIHGFGKKSVKSIIQSINNHKEVPDYQVLGALGIESIGKKTFQKVCSEYSIDELIQLSKDNDISSLCKISGINQKTSKKILDGLKDNKKLIKFLIKTLDIIETDGLLEPKFTVCFTKIRDKSEEDLIRRYGGEVVESLSKNTSILVVPTKNSESAKIEKAKKYGIPIIPIDDLDAFIFENFNN